MKQQAPTIEAKPREKVGSVYARRLRKTGRLPAVIYGHKKDPVPITIDEDEILSHLRHGTHVLTVDVEGARSETCLVKDLQFGYLGDNVIHVDFARVSLEEEVNVHVHLTFVGEPHAATRGGAILNYDLTDLEVICRVNEIPEEIKVDLTVMGEGLMLTVGDLTLPSHIQATVPPETPVVHVSFVKRDEEAVVGEEAEVTAEDTEPEVISEAKGEEAGEGKESEGSA
ncbi:MAG: 50S ribosomal protein L25 [Planctomycetota bacterium]|jgi:large subunit ribosomal protein L25